MDDDNPQDCEYRVIRMLESILSNEVATIISGYKEQCLADIVKCINSGMKISDSEFDVLVILKVSRIMCSSNVICLDNRCRYIFCASK